MKWHDGQAVDADDVVYTLNYLTDPKVTLRYKAYWAWIDKIEKLGTHKVRVTAKRPVPDGLMYLAMRTPMYPQHVHGPLANKLDFAAKPVGTGPFRIVQLDQNTGIVGEKYAGYVPSSVKDPSGVGRVVAQPIKDHGTIAANLITGNADVALDLPPDMAADLVKSGNFEVTLAPPNTGYTFIQFPSKGWDNVKALADVRVRTAIIKAIDRDTLVKVKFGDLGKGMSPPEALCSKQQLGCGYTKLVPKQDIAGAKKLLAEAGYADGFDVVINGFQAQNAEMTATAGMLRAVGIRATVRQHPTAQRVQLIAQGKVDIGMYGWSGGGMFEVSSQIVRHFLSKEYDDPALVKMAEETGAMMNDAERRKAVAKLMDYAHDKAYAFPMVSNRVIFTHTKEVKLLVSDLRNGQVQPHEFGWK